MKTFFLWFVSILFIVFLAAGFVLSEMDSQSSPDTWREALRDKLGPSPNETLDPDKPLEEQTHIMEIGGRTFEFPLMYIDGPLETKRGPNSVVMEYVLPDFKAIPQFESRKAYKKAFNDQRLGGLLLEPSAKRPSFKVMIRNHRRGLTKEEHAGTFDGLEVYKWYHGKDKSPEYDSRVYLEKNNNQEIVSWIKCDPRDSVQYPGCDHHFRDKGLLYDIHYNRKKYLDNWRQQRTKTIEFIDQFEIDDTSDAN